LRFSERLPFILRRDEVSLFDMPSRDFAARR
jgi:hypothetical protein